MENTSKLYDQVIPMKRDKKRRMILAGAVFICVGFLAAQTAMLSVPVQVLGFSGSHEQVKQIFGLGGGNKGSAQTAARTVEGDGAWMLSLVNGAHPLPDTYVPELTKLSNGLKFDKRAVKRLDAMLDAMREQGLSPVVCSAYRSYGKQQSLFDAQLDKLADKGLSPEQADAKARMTVAYPGTSEHHLGLAVDLVSASYQGLDDAQADTPEMRWLFGHCAEYGFIMRYPKDKTDITGIVYEPWHFRYVGVEAAQAMTERGLCLEEYIELIEREGS